jgi:hypothetical protein
VGRSPDAVRQVASRARRRLQEERPPPPREDERTAEVMRRFREVARGEADLQDLLDVISPDVVLVTDGGGVRKAALRPIHGIEKVMRFLAATAAQLPNITGDLALVNGQPAIVLERPDGIDAVVTVRVEDGRVTEIYMVRNPAKLARLTRPVALRR